MEKIQFVNEILQRNNYVVNIYRTPNGCVASYPAKVEPPGCSSSLVEYEYKECGVYTVITDEYGQVHRTLNKQCPNYASRIMIFSSIASSCLFINYNLGLVSFFDGDDKVNEFDFYQLCANNFCVEEDIELENKLRPIIEDCIIKPRVVPTSASFTEEYKLQAEAAGVLEGYLAIKQSLFGKEEN